MRKFIQLKTELPGPKSRELVARREAVMPAGYAKSTPLAVKRAHGALVEDMDGNIVIDFTGGIGVLNVGHNTPEVVAAVKAQADELIHACGLVATTEPHVQLAEKLCAIAPISGPKKAMIQNTGPRRLRPPSSPPAPPPGGKPSSRLRAGITGARCSPNRSPANTRCSRKGLARSPQKFIARRSRIFTELAPAR